MPLDIVSAVPPPAEGDPRPLHDRIAAGVRRHGLRLAGGLALAGGLCFGGWKAAAALPAAPFLAVENIVVQGNEQLSDGEALALLSGLRGARILSVDLEEQRRRLSASPWVAGSVLRRRLPSTVEVFVAERRPAAVARFGGRLFLIDASGAVLGAWGPRFARFDFPIVDGLAGPGGVEPARMALAARLLAQLAGQPDLMGAVSQIDVADPDDAVVLLDGDAVSLHLGAERFAARLRLYAGVAAVLREQIPGIAAVDLRFDPRVIVRRAGGAAPGRPRRRAGAVEAARAARPDGVFASRR